MFRGKESSNRIELSRLVQDLLNFGVSGSLRLWGGGRWMGGHLGAWGGVPTHAHTCMHARTHAHLYMYRNCKWPPNMEASMFSMFSMFNMHVPACVRACACVHAWDTLTHTHAHPHPHPPIRHPPRGVNPRNHLKFDNTSTYQDISIPFEDLKSVKNSPPMGGCVVWWVGGWLGGLMGGVRSNH